MVKASMAGTVWKILVRPGDQVQAGQDLLILESMKMEIPIGTETDGVVKAVLVKEGYFVNAGDPVVELD